MHQKLSLPILWLTIPKLPFKKPCAYSLQSQWRTAGYAKYAVCPTLALLPHIAIAVAQQSHLSSVLTPFPSLIATGNTRNTSLLPFHKTPLLALCHAASRGVLLLPHSGEIATHVQHAQRARWEKFCFSFCATLFLVEHRRASV